MSRAAVLGFGFSVLVGTALADPGVPAVEILAQSPSRTVLEVRIPDVDVAAVDTDSGSFCRIGLAGEVMAVIEEGRPEVPKVSALLAIPTGASVDVRATVVESQELAIEPVYPQQPPLLDGQEPAPLVIDRAFYRQDVSFPGYDVRLIETGIWRDLAVANIQVYPVQVNAATGKVRVASRIRVEVRYSGGRYPTQVADWMFPIYGAYVDNFENLPVRPMADYVAGTRYLVFRHSAYAANSLLNDSLLGWVHRRGYDVRVITADGMSAAAIRDTIRAEYESHSPPVLQYVLLVGERAQVPTGQYSGVGISDFYYSDLQPAPTGDNYPEIGIARFSPTSNDDLSNQIRKSLKYQKAPVTTNNWLTNLTMVAHRELYPGKYSGCVRGIYHMPKPYYGPVVDTIMGQFLGNTHVASTINSGVGIVPYRGHGDYTEWWQWAVGGQSWYNSDIEALTNGEMTPVVYNIACNNGDISQSECLAEKWMRKYPGGAVANLGATQASYTYPNHGICSTLVRATCDTWTITVPGVRDYAGPIFNISQIMMYMDAYVAKYWPSSPYPYNIWMYLTLGDPAMPVWSGGMPQVASVDYPDSIPLGPYDLNVTVTARTDPVEDALVCAWRQGEFYVAERTDANGIAVLSVNAGTPGPVLVTVSEGHTNHSNPGLHHVPILPFEGTTMAGGGGQPQPNIIYSGNRVDDAGGNNNGRFDPGETADIIVAVRNTGNAPADSLVATLVSGNSQFAITDPSGAFGNVPAGSTATNDGDRFTAVADAGIPGGTTVPCTLHLHSANWGDWTYTFALRVGDPPVPGQYVVDLDTGAVRLSLCGIGSIGYDEPPSLDLGAGFQVPKGTVSSLYFGSLMAGTSPAYLVDHHYSQPANSGTNHDWEMTDSFRIVLPPDPADEHWVGMMSDGGHSSPQDLEVEQHWYMNAERAYDDWAIGVLDFRNNGSAAINGLYVGMIGDFDVGSDPQANVAGSDTVRRTVHVAQSSSEYPTVGFKVLDPPSFANLSVIDHAVYVYPDSCMTDGQKWRFLDGTIVQRQSNRSYDWSAIVSAGPFDLPIGVTQRVAFAVVGAVSRAGFLEAADSVQSWYEHMSGVRESETMELAIPERPLLLSPNPFRRGTYVHYFAKSAGPIELQVYDASGRQAESLVREAAAGSGRLYWEPGGLARGVYFLKVRVGDSESVAKVMLLD